MHCHLRITTPTAGATLAAAIIGLSAGTNALASGFGVAELSLLGMGTANALVANPDEPGAIAYNPAAIAFQPQSSWSAAAMFINPNFSVTTASGKHDSQGADWHTTPLLNVAVRIDDKWAAGLSVNAPFGLETRWPVGTFPELAGTMTVPTPLGPTSIPLSAQPTQSKAEILDFTPTFTYRVTDEFAVSAGADIYWNKSSELNSTLTATEGDGSGWGFNLSAMYVKDALSLGANFHSAATVSVDGYYDALNATLVAAGALPASQSAKLDLNLPWRLQLGLRYEITDDLAAEFDWTRTGWSEFEEITINLTGTGGSLPTDVNDWTDTNAYRLGLTYDLQENTQLRIGYSYDETPQGKNNYTARIPDADRHLFGFGVAQSLGQGWQVEAGYMYVMNGERNYNGSQPYVPGGPTNGTTAYAGKYEAHANLFGLGITKTFDAF